MDSKRRRLTEGQMCLFSLARSVDKSKITEAIEKGLKTARCGRILGSGMSFAGDGTISIEIGAYDCERASEVIGTVCRRFKSQDYEIVWD